MPAFSPSLTIGPCRAAPAAGKRGSPRRLPLVPTCFAHTASNHGRQGCPQSVERILRYPDGNVRRIRYPAPVDPTPDLEAASDTISLWKPAAAQRGATPPQPPPMQTPKALPAAAQAPPVPAAPQQQAPPKGGSVPDSPLQLLRYLTSDAYKASQRELWRKVRESYEVLDASPWVAPRPLYVLATQQAGREAGLTYTLRTRVGRPELEDELTRLLGGRRRPDGTPLIRCGDVVDGVVAFESEDEAQRFGELVEAEGAAEVSVARCDSHALFRSVQDVRGVVVLVRPGADFTPQPHELATALRGQRSLEEPEEGSASSA